MHKFNPVAFAAQKQAKVDQKANVKTTPKPDKLPDLVTRVQLLEAVLGL